MNISNSVPQQQKIKKVQLLSMIYDETNNIFLEHVWSL